MIEVITKATICIFVASSILQDVVGLALRACIDRIVVIGAWVGSIEVELYTVGKELIDILVVVRVRTRIIV